MSLCADGPRHIGIDSQSCLDNILQLIYLAANLPPNCDIYNNNHTIKYQRRHCTGTLRKHWKMQNNGDYWQALLHIIYTKQFQSVLASKVKGHATSEHIQQGLPPSTNHWATQLPTTTLTGACCSTGRISSTLPSGLPPGMLRMSNLFSQYNNFWLICYTLPHNYDTTDSTPPTQIMTNHPKYDSTYQPSSTTPLTVPPDACQLSPYLSAFINIINISTF